ncbi:hypothetical protein [Gordonia sp. NB41Y]|uniref:hypothetical protein n=1 Tax=Gordonia sp. NB41Y TaxID=875808 RepID=UPI0006B15C58|nr:hypothetical protein [Gordonia sp. NB41Y]KOY50046.1 hypothetical protein ISGA_06265 [Gordonia sp. NB41Y]WLP91310.1 hypothetical protein Q9K23_03300 [Gordonia sp. NB41Y]
MITPIPESEVVAQLRELMQEQPWWRRFANAVTAGVGATTMILWLLVTNGVDVPAQVQTGIASAIAILTTLGVLQTRNGLTPRGIDRVEQAADLVAARGGRHRRAGE